jgi:hypothetical protein
MGDLKPNGGDNSHRTATRAHALPRITRRAHLLPRAPPYQEQGVAVAAQREAERLREEEAARKPVVKVKVDEGDVDMFG